MSRTQPQAVPSPGALGLVEAAEQPHAAAPQRPAAAAAAPTADATGAFLVDESDFLLDDEDWERFTEAVTRPARDLPRLRAFLNTPIQAIAE